ncbi:tubulin-like doman-containing protein [Microcoleus sp. PH2017_05_CCC_O_A]|uniref:tubulin-like doman-containing protein n=1 Tax=Microcoleus sp. PH2017_05_CCC_O_A TaxID=2798816 RepID=UPI001D3C438D|nr:tubulin-like doman-containing protein [Microcoleus sp. PH2017_05_CCC_O_A]MCC3436918.1 hypothetical protein [Microcoleus sp. PH2017_05_CCC_O_A]TAG59217.1 MAG: hypothetical protein EAZ28_12075 [Oscillatoriales cyanobacterium]
MKKTIIIGIGGTGLTTIREVRRLIAERYELGLRAPEVSSVKFLYIDTHEGDIDKLNWSVLGKDICLTRGEKVIITGDRLQSMVENPDDYPDISPWLPPIKNYVGDPGPGAKGIRPYGRLIYEYNENKKEVQNKVFDCYNSLNQSFSQLQDWRFYLVCGLSGGTGSGMFVPLSFDLQRWDLYQKGTALKKFYSFLVLPPLQIVRHNRYHSNAYAVLSELNYFAFQPEQLPYDNCYLLEPRNARGLEIGLENLPLLIAQRIFLNIQGGPAASYIDAIMDNPQLGDVENDEETGRRHSLRFSTFGLSTVSYPREVVAQCLAYRLALQVISTWVEEGVYQQNINQQVRDELKSIRLSLSHIYGDADPFGNNDFPDYAIQINNLVNENLQGITKKQLGEKVEKVRRRIEISFRDNIGITDFYTQRVNDVSGAVTESLKQTRLKITAFLRSPKMGIIYAKKFLDELINILTDFKADVSGMASEKNANIIRTFQDNLADTVSVVRANEQKLMYTNSAFQKDYANISDELKQYLKGLASFQVGKYGLVFLDRVIPQIRNLRAELDVWESRVIELQEILAGRLKIILEDIQKGTKENGKTIFSELGLQRLVEETNSSVIQAAIEELIRSTLGQENLDLISLIKVTKKEPEDILYESAYQWVLSENCPVDIKRLTLYDKFVSEYSNSVKRQDILSSAKMLSAPFLKFAPSEVGKKQILSTEAAVTTIPDGTGRISSDGRPAQTVVQADLEGIGVPADSIKVAEDQERIIFLQEKQVFPLRFIESLSRLKENYDQFPERAALHIDKTIEPYLYELYMLSKDEKKALLETEEVFILSRAYSWIAATTNQYTRKDEIRYEFEERGKMGVQKLVLGFDWETAFEAFVKDAILSNPKYEQVRKARELLTVKVRQVRKEAKTAPIVADDIRKRLEEYLQTCSSEYQAGIDDPRYERAQKLINRILNSLY